MDFSTTVDILPFPRKARMKLKHADTLSVKDTSINGYKAII